MFPFANAIENPQLEAEDDDEDGFVFKVPRLVSMSIPTLEDGYMSSIMKWSETSQQRDTISDSVTATATVRYRKCDFERSDDDDHLTIHLSDDRDEIDAESQCRNAIQKHRLLRSDSATNRNSCESDSSQKSEDSFSSFAQLEVNSVQETVCQNILAEHVRWFYRQESEKKWTPFIGFDSLRIELKYRELRKFDLDLHDSSLSEFELNALKSDEKIVVRGGLYEVDVTERICTSIFWAGDTSAILRGVWFYDGTWQPIDECFSEEIETEHLRIFRDYDFEQQSQLDSPRRNATQALHHVQFTDFHVEWYGPTEVYLYSEAKSSKIMRSVSERLGFQKSGYRLQRGYFGDASTADKQPDITHLVFVIHGIGQKIDTQRIIRNCGSLRKCANWLKEKYFSHLAEANERSEFFPVEWRSSLKLDGDTVDSITLHRVRGLREFLNSSAMDILYYSSPLYRNELIKGLQSELNRLYKLFCQRNPYFESRGGKVSVIAHSLGCVITYDIITGWNPMRLYESFVADNVERLATENGSSEAETKLLQRLHAAKHEVLELEKELRVLCDAKANAHNKKNNLLFEVENFFCLGSPLAVFLALRGMRPTASGKQDEILPTSLVKRLFNIYHPTDPVAYRLEPLILKHYTTIMPLHIHYYGTADKKSYDLMKPELLPIENQDKRPHSPTSDDCYDSSSGSPSKSARGESRWSMVWSSLVRRKENVAPSSQELKDIKSDGSDNDEPTSPTHQQDGVKDFRLNNLKVENEEDEDDSKLADDSLLGAVGGLEPSGGTLSSIPSSNSDFSSPKTPEPTELEHRLDYMLREGNLESSYISCITSHTSYWTSYDIAYFILSFLHPSSDQPDSSAASPIHTTK